MAECAFLAPRGQESKPYASAYVYLGHVRVVVVRCLGDNNAVAGDVPVIQRPEETYTAIVSIRREL
jgi:hypothetical protein